MSLYPEIEGLTDGSDEAASDLSFCPQSRWLGERLELETSISALLS
jgi:hypothetical protein